MFFSEGARNNDVISTAYVGDMLMRGAGVKVDYEAALEHFKKSEVCLVSCVCIFSLPNPGRMTSLYQSYTGVYIT